MENIKTNQFNHLTAKERDSLSFPAKVILERNLLAGEVLDFGCGFGKDVSLLQEKGINIMGYDKHYFPEYPQKKFDTITCFYVLNVLLQEEQSMVLMEIAQLLKPSGKAYFAVRRDIQYEGYRTHKIHQQKTYQCNVLLNSKVIFENKSCAIYEYQHFNQLKHSVNQNCPFCNPDSARELIVETATMC
jgi:2-polyprenyl-3-methyl-5-hydroxy-6-metoxy-1,4-benzoquinol methylase